MKALTEQLADWEDLDIVYHKLAVLLGMVDENKGSFQVDFKWIYWTKNQYRDVLEQTIFGMVEAGILEHDEEESRIRANDNFEMEVPEPRT